MSPRSHVEGHKILTSSRERLNKLTRTHLGVNGYENLSDKVARGVRYITGEAARICPYSSGVCGQTLLRRELA